MTNVRLRFIIIKNVTKGMFEKICFDYQWNQDSDRDFIYDIFRVHSWNEIINIIKNKVIKYKYINELVLLIISKSNFFPSKETILTLDG